MPIHIESHEIQIWSTPLTLTSAQEAEQYAILSPDECERADRYHFALHRKHFIAARAFLRQITSLYTEQPAHAIQFAYDENEKPFLADEKDRHLQFNLSHSEELAIIAFTLNHAIGVDIEKIRPDYNTNVAKRFFSPQENEQLELLPDAERMQGFYRIWARKEAIVKAVGKGLSLPLHMFSVSINDIYENVTLTTDGNWSLAPLSLDAHYQSAVATNQTIKKISFWKLIEQLPNQYNVYNL